MSLWLTEFTSPKSSVTIYKNDHICLMVSNVASPLSVFISYSHRDEDYKDDLVVHLASLKRQGKILAWQNRDIEAGAEWDAEIKQQLESAEIILLLITPRFLASDYCYDLEMQRAVQRHHHGRL